MAEIAPQNSAPPAAPPPTPQQSIDEDASIIADLRKEHFAKTGAEPKDGEEHEPEEADEEPAETEAEEKPEREEKPGNGKPREKTAAPKYKTAAAALKAITAALESGDPKKIAAAVGKPESFFNASGAKWAVFREQTKMLKERTKAVAQRETEFNAKLEQARSEYAPVMQAAQAFREGKLDQFVQLIEHITGESYEEATRKVIKGETALSPEMKAVRKEMAQLKAELAAEKAKKSEQTEQEQRQAQAQRALSMAREELADHPIARLKGFERIVLDRVRQSWDADVEDYTMSLEEAADAIVEERREEARHFSRGKQLPAPASVRAPQPPPRGRAADARPPDGEPWLQRDLTEEELVASIERDHRAGRIRPI
jgi:hypothetical protein